MLPPRAPVSCSAASALWRPPFQLTRRAVQPAHDEACARLVRRHLRWLGPLATRPKRALEEVQHGKPRPKEPQNAAVDCVDGVDAHRSHSQMLRLNLRLAGAAVAAVAAPAALLSLNASSTVRANGEIAGAAPYPAPAPLDPQSFKPFKLAAVEKLTPDTKKYTFALEREDQELGMTSASLLLVKADVDGACVCLRGGRRKGGEGAAVADCASACVTV